MKKVVLLSAYGAPISTAYLQRLVQISGMEIFVVYELNPKLQDTIARIYKERFGNSAPVFLPPEKIMSPKPVKVFTISQCNSPENLQLIRNIKPDLIILGGTGIVKEELLAIPSVGTINCHPGILPRYRGCTCVEWAIYEDEPVGATCHFVTKEIDAGDILIKKTMPILKGMTYRDIRLSMFYFQADLLALCLKDWAENEKQDLRRVEAFDWNSARYYNPIPDPLLQEVLKKITEQTYLHMKDSVDD